MYRIPIINLFNPKQLNFQTKSDNSKLFYKNNLHEDVFIKTTSHHDICFKGIKKESRRKSIIKDNENWFDLTLREYIDSLEHPLPEKEQIRLFKILKDEKCSEKEKQNIREKLINTNLRFAVFVAKRFYAYEIEPMDLVQTANIGLIKAVKTFDPYKTSPYNSKHNIKFLTYAELVIANEIRMDFRRLNRQNLRHKKVKEYFIAEDKLTDKLGRHPTNEEIRQELKIPLHELAFITSLLEGILSADVEDRYGRVKVPIKNLIPDIRPEPVDIIVEEHSNEDYENAIRSLSPKEQLVIRLKYPLDGKKQMNQYEISDMLNHTQSYISKIERGAIKKIRKKLLSDYGY